MGQNFSSIWDDCLKRKKKEAEQNGHVHEDPRTVTTEVEVPGVSENLNLEASKSPETSEDLDSVSAISGGSPEGSQVLPPPPGVTFRSVPKSESRPQSIQFKRISQYSHFSNPDLPSPAKLHPILRPQSSRPNVFRLLADNKQPPKLLFAARRSASGHGSFVIDLFGPKSMELFKVNEKCLKEYYNLALGDFLTAKVDKDGSFYDLEKAPAIGNAHVKVVEDVAYIFNVKVKLVSIDGRCVLQSLKFADAISQEQLETGDYYVRISMLPAPIQLSTGSIIYLEGTNAKKIPPNQNGKKADSKKVSKEKKRTPEPGAGAVPQDPCDTSSLPSTTKLQESSRMIYGAGFPAQQAPDSEEQKIIFGAGFPENKKPAKPPKKVKVPQIMRALVIDTKLKKNGHTIHYLWVLEAQKEGRLTKRKHTFEKGHFFQGAFVPHLHLPGQLQCDSYEKPLEPIIPGGLDDEGKLWLVVKVENIEEAEGDRFGKAEGEHVGTVVDGETEETKLSIGDNEGLVRIQRMKIGEKEMAWRVVEILRDIVV